MISNSLVSRAVCADARDVMALVGDCWARMNTSSLHLHTDTRCVRARVRAPVAGANAHAHAACIHIAIVRWWCVDEEVRPAAARHARAVHVSDHCETGGRARIVLNVHQSVAVGQCMFVVAKICVR